ncbi:hypothetical protein TIFTF001_048652 [Ficus carica]|uniref:Uncharacterized protein n=1 Tax=Ficus carica TaxID=3494 RepID=A0AA88CKH2_FICCA|nr:hypothetical protein TIFTF001_048650 [Ficus carica]GMN19692.1 hypothetical protein TIFTF001_048652 [Ficus carica]
MVRSLVEQANFLAHIHPQLQANGQAIYLAHIHPQRQANGQAIFLAHP